MPSPLLTPLADWVRRQKSLRRAAHATARLIPDVPRTVRIDSLGPVRIRLRRHRWYLWEKFGEHDGPIFAAFERIIEPGAVAWDIGANIGVYGRVMRQWFGAETLVAVEPMADNFALLEENVRLGRLDRTHLLHMALSDRDGEESLQIDDVTSGTAVLDSISGGAASQGRLSAGLAPRTERVQVRTLDGLVERDGLPAPTAMKIDTEGAEVKVLMGAERTLRSRRVRMAIALHGPDKAAGTVQALAHVGYVCFGMVREADGTAWRRLGVADSTRLANNNVVAGPASDSALLATPPRFEGPWPRNASRSMSGSTPG